MANKAKGVEDFEKSIKNTNETLAALCKQFNLQEPDLTSEPPISKETLKAAINRVLDLTVPGSELIKIALGTTDRPQSTEEWLKLAAETALDFMPGGKIFKFLKGGVAKLGIKKIEEKLLKEAAKAAKRTAKQEVRKVRKAKRAERKLKRDTAAQQNTEGSTKESVEGKPTTSKEQKKTPKTWNGKYKKKKAKVSGKKARRMHLNGLRNTGLGKEKAGKSLQETSC